jgi:protein-S-isoprenylcysteine O-methyltransferase Ste14
LRPGLAIVVLWIGFAVSWTAAALWSGRTEKRAGHGVEASYRIPLLIGLLIFAVPAHGYRGPLRLWHIGFVGAWICVLVIALGLAFSWWARIHLGSLWSSRITKKADHQVIESGPYGIVRHPIYTGILLAILATTAAKGTVLGLAGLLIITFGFWLKARLEERWLCKELPPEAYDAYRRRVPMLVPFGPRSS